MTRAQKFAYGGIVAACFVAAVWAGWTNLGIQYDNNVFDFLLRFHPPDWTSSSVIAGIDERSLHENPSIRRILADGLPLIAAAKPVAVGVDVILADPGDPRDTADLAAAFAQVPNLVLGTNLTSDGAEWEQPLPVFRRSAAALGHVQSEPDPRDNVLRRIPLQVSKGQESYFALSFEVFRRIHQDWQLLERPDALELGPQVIPARRSEDEFRPMLIRYLASIPRITFHELKQDPGAAARVAGKVVFVGVTAQGATQDRYMTPYSGGQTSPGVEIHANAFETLVRGQYLRPARNSLIVLFCGVLAALIGVIFYRFSGWVPYGLAAVLIAAMHTAPYFAFRANIVFPYAAPLATAWLTFTAAASFQHFVVRRMLAKSEIEREGYQKAIHFVAHEMRTPLTAIQGSSELMGRYKLPEKKQAELAGMINSESKRLARMIQTFLDVERLTAGQMELKREPFDAGELMRVCVDRARPLAERKRIRLNLEELEGATVHGDRELTEYALYNLITNAIKYSDSDTEVSVGGERRGGSLRMAVRDQGIGMDEKELSSIFRKFYRTKRAEASGEVGTGIGLSIVEQIVAQHGGKMEVASSPGAGSCFTMVLPAGDPVTRKSD